MSAPLVSVVIPVYNKRDFVRACLDSVVAAAQEDGRVEVIVVDHHSTDGSYEVAEEHARRAPGTVCVVRHAGGTISQVRNVGARLARGELLSFIDSDCVVPPGFFGRVVEEFAAHDAGAVGCEYDIPAEPHWSERVWYELHVVREDGWRHYLNGGDLAIRRAAFERIGGFAEHLAVGEDTEICGRLRAAGFGIWESQRLRVVHLGNPKSVAAFFRKQAWHGISILDDPSLRGMNKATLMIYTFTLLCAAAVLVLLLPSPLGASGRLLVAAACVLAVPTAAVAYRMMETRRLVNPIVAIALYVVYFAARAKSLLVALAHPQRRAVA